MLKFPKIKLDLYDLASFPGRRFRSPSCGEGPLWALSGSRNRYSQRLLLAIRHALNN